MSVTLLALSRQYAAGKISKEHYRAHRRALLEEQVFHRDEQTIPASVASHNVQEPRGVEFTQPVPTVNRQVPVNQPLPAMDTTTFSQSERLKNLSGDTHNGYDNAAYPASSNQPRLHLKWIGAVLFGLSLALGALWLLSEDNETPKEVKADPLVIQTQLLLENPDWQVADIKRYRDLIKSQDSAMRTEQTELLSSVNLYLSVPANGDATALDEQVQQLQSELEALTRRDR